jgi:hypothetical protein
VSWEVEFFEDDDGDEPVTRFLLDLKSPKRLAAIAAIEIVLAQQGIDVCRSDYGRPLGDGLYEFRVRRDESTIRKRKGGATRGSSEAVLLRFFFTVYGDRIVLLLGGYDKGDDPSTRRQDREIRRARKRLRSFKLTQAREKAAARRRRD